jgi:hypothetical protein
MTGRARTTVFFITVGGFRGHRMQSGHKSQSVASSRMTTPVTGPDLIDLVLTLSFTLYLSSQARSGQVPSERQTQSLLGKAVLTGEPFITATTDAIKESLIFEFLRSESEREIF